jgi:hypothetical protein
MPWDTSKATTCDDHYNFCTLHVDGNGNRWVPSTSGSASGFSIEDFTESWWLWNNECGKCTATCGLWAKGACIGMVATQTPALIAAMAFCAAAPEACGGV